MSVAATTAVVAGCAWLLFSGLVAPTCMCIGRKLHLVRELPLPAPANPPLETVAADLRRLRRELDHPGPGLPMTRRRAVLQAYDDRLLDACRELDVPVDPARTRDPGTERQHLELLLEQAGLMVTQRSR